MSVESDHLAAAARFYAHVEAGEWDEAQRYVTDDYTVVEAADLPFGGVQRGRAAVREAFEVLERVFDLVAVQNIATTAGGDYLVAILDLVVRDADGGTFPLHLAEVIEFRGDLIASTRPFYFDHRDVARAVAAKDRVRSAT